MMLHVFESSLLMELGKFNFKPAGNMLFYDTALCPQFVHALIVAEHGTKRCWFWFFLFYFFLLKKKFPEIFCVQVSERVGQKEWLDQLTLAFAFSPACLNICAKCFS